MLGHDNVLVEDGWAGDEDGVAVAGEASVSVNEGPACTVTP